MDFLLGVVYFVFDAAAALLLVATWQRTRITGFLVLASSYVLGILARWIMPLLYRGLGGDGGLTVLIQSLWLLIAAVALYGLWDIYRQLKRPAHAAPATD
ncbi:MAG: hypothetical protein K0M70_10490 [Arenimonas sp.]|uniref:hypothetical protein n=1 Tax=Arenimonas sp. TaxID=1872635 RepID=UPI0025C61C77|nr:hypothetical protein [Arenimonas sp.]MBW8368270.1 hypothetical protein [Arenimonas sp.]